jgi:hypothetical protein
MDYEVRLVALQALAQANVRALEERREHGSVPYSIGQYIEQLIAATLREEQELEQRTDMPLEITEEDVPF